jgi:Lon protease-like protein
MSDTPLDVGSVLAGFSGEVPLFPLPSLVVLPDTLAPLQIFEDRYRKMTADALDGERLIGMALLKPGWETAYQGSPPIHDVVGLSAILTHERLKDGRYKILLYGVARARVLEEVETAPYRRARVEIVQDHVEAARERDLDERIHRALEMLPGRRGRIGKVRLLATQVRGAGGGPGRLVDAMAEAGDLEPDERYRILAEPDVLRRLEFLVDLLDRRRRAEDDLPTSADPRWN